MEKLKKACASARRRWNSGKRERNGEDPQGKYPEKKGAKRD